jgi:hypothetical protein
MDVILKQKPLGSPSRNWQLALVPRLHGALRRHESPAGVSIWYQSQGIPDLHEIVHVVLVGHVFDVVCLLLLVWS